MLPPEPSPIRISGTPRITVTARAHHTDPNPLVQNTPIAVDLYDVAPSGRATLITQNVSMLERGRPGSVSTPPTGWCAPATVSWCG